MSWSDFFSTAMSGGNNPAGPVGGGSQSTGGASESNSYSIGGGVAAPVTVSAPIRAQMIVPGRSVIQVDMVNGSGYINGKPIADLVKYGLEYYSTPNVRQPGGQFGYYRYSGSLAYLDAFLSGGGNGQTVPREGTVIPFTTQTVDPTATVPNPADPSTYPQYPPTTWGTGQSGQPDFVQGTLGDGLQLPFNVPSSGLIDKVVGVAVVGVVVAFLFKAIK